MHRYEIGDRVGASAVREDVLEDIAGRDPILFVGCGHGNEDVFTGQDFDIIWWTCDCKELAGRVVYLLSCETGVRLGPDMVKNKKAVCYIGYNKIFGWIQEVIGDPLDDKYGRGFFEAVLELLYKLTDGRTTGEAQAASIDVWNKWIDYWSKSSDPYAPLVLQWMINDRDAQILIGDSGARVTPAPAIPDLWWLLTMSLGAAPVGVVLAVAGAQELRKAGVIS